MRTAKKMMMMSGKKAGSGDIPVEAWRYLGERGYGVSR